MNKAASQLGKMAAGVPKKFSAAELVKRTARLKAAQKKRAKTQRVVGPTGVKYIKTCACCGKYLKRHRWMEVGGYDYNQNKRPICWDCDASYE